MASVAYGRGEADRMARKAEVRVRVRELLDLVQPLNDDDDEAPPSDAHILAQQVLGAKTLASAHKRAQASIDFDEIAASYRKAIVPKPLTESIVKAATASAIRDGVYRDGEITLKRVRREVVYRLALGDEGYATLKKKFKAVMKTEMRRGGARGDSSSLAAHDEWDLDAPFPGDSA